MTNNILKKRPRLLSNAEDLSDQEKAIRTLLRLFIANRLLIFSSYLLSTATKATIQQSNSFHPMLDNYKRKMHETMSQETQDSALDQGPRRSRSIRYF